MIQEKIEILPTRLLDENRAIVEELKYLAHRLKLEFGWHYLLDLSWIIGNLGAIQGKYIMDAGAGTGILQWYLADQGATVLSVDRGSRADLPIRFRRRYNVRGLRTASSALAQSQPDLLPTSTILARSLKNPRKAAASFRELFTNSGGKSEHNRQSSQIFIYNQDLGNLVDIAENTLDAIVAVSALEHNPPEQLPAVVAELMRVLKPGGMLLATLGAALDQDWYHTPSAGWCYTEETLQNLFGLLRDVPSNYDQYDALFAELVNCAELRDNLASFYSRSGDNGMPWGKWDPQYQSVGVCKIKHPD